ncbi:MAG TPA: nucleotidyltransferase family protein [Bacillales bacterium]|nr:nucleotidyltransferase family protein [Bacillales bacterium]
MKMTDVTALILAAGTSSRMGEPKQLLGLGGTPLLKRVIDAVLPCGFSEIVTVIGHEAERIQQAISIPDPRFRWVVNARYLSGQSTSLFTGLEVCRSASVMIFLGDEPLLSERTVDVVFRAGLEQQALSDEPFAVRPSFQSVPGHPVFLGNVKKLDFSGLQGDEGAKTILSSMEAMQFLPVGDRGVLFDVDTPEHYEKARQIWMWEAT